MEKLMKPAEYAQELGISRQAVYAKIKRGILTAKNVEGKLYIIVDKNEKKEVAKTVVTNTVKPKVTRPSVRTDTTDYRALLEAKDETISVLKGTVKDLKKSNKQVSSTLKGEIDLLKEAFHEMRSLYVLQLEQKNPKREEEAIEVYTEEEHVEEENIEVEHSEEEIERWIGLKKFFKLHSITKEKQQEKIIKRLKKAYKRGDERLMEIEDKLKLNANKKYKDILN